MFSRQVENTVGKGEIAHYENFSFSLRVFEKLILQTCKNQGLFGTGLKTIPRFNDPEEEGCGKHYPKF